MATPSGGPPARSSSPALVTSPEPALLSAFRPVPRTGVIYVTAEATRHGHRPDDPSWPNLGQGPPETGPPPQPVGDRRCWGAFGADPRRSLGRPDATLGLPERRFTWTRGLGTYIEFPPVYCEGELYVNGFSGTTFALAQQTAVS